MSVERSNYKMVPDFLNVYCINLLRRSDRWDYMQTVAKQAGLHLTRVIGVDAQDPANEDALNAMIKIGPVGIIGIGARACTASHTLAWLKFVDSGEAYGVFLEDDVTLSNDFKIVVNSILANPPLQDVIKIECGGSATRGLVLGPKLREHNGRWMRNCYQLCTDAAGYILSRHGAKTALARVKDCDVGLDHFLFYPISRHGGACLPFAIIAPTIVIQDRSMNSDISNTRFEGSQFVRRLRRGSYEAALAPSMLWHLFNGAKIITAPFQK